MKKKRMSKNRKGYGGIHYVGGIEGRVLAAWKRGERTPEEIAKLTKYPLSTVYRYIPERKEG